MHTVHISSVWEGGTALTLTSFPNSDGKRSLVAYGKEPVKDCNTQSFLALLQQCRSVRSPRFSKISPLNGMNDCNASALILITSISYKFPACCSCWILATLCQLRATESNTVLRIGEDTFTMNYRHPLCLPSVCTWADLITSWMNGVNLVVDLLFTQYLSSLSSVSLLMLWPSIGGLRISHA